MLRVLDGQQCRLDTKYGRVFTKEKNVPIIVIANVIPEGMRDQGALQERFMRLLFTSRIEELEELATLYGCIQRRLEQKVVEWKDAKGIKIQ